MCHCEPSTTRQCSFLNALYAKVKMDTKAETIRFIWHKWKFFLQSCYCCHWPLRNFNHLSQGVVSIAHSTKPRGNWSTLVNRRLRLNLHVLNSFANMEGVKIMPRSPFKDVASSAFKNSPMQTLCCFFAYNANLVVQHWTKVLHTRYKSFLLQRN